MPNLLVAHKRPGFYFRVIVEGRVRAGDAIVRTRRGRHELSVADVDALLYLPTRDIDQLSKIVDVPALSPGWQRSFRDMLAAHESTAAPPKGVEPKWSGFRQLRVVAIRQETPTVLSIELEAIDHSALPTPLPGQYLTIRIPDAGDPPPLRSYSLSGDPGAGRYRISVKREDRGVVSRWLHTHIKPGSVVEVAAPRGEFYLIHGANPVVFVSAGIGATPVLAMMHALVAAHSRRQIWWVHTTRNARAHVFAAEVRTLIKSLPNAQQHIFYTGDEGADGFTVHGRLNHQSIAALGLPPDATVYLCGPASFMADMREALAAAGINPTSIHTELFGALPPVNPGIVASSQPVQPHPPDGAPGTGPRITFSRSGLSVKWSPNYHTLLELAEACDIPTRFSCRSGVCHTCVTHVIEGATTYKQRPLEAPAAGAVLICLAAPRGDLVLDL